MTATFPHLQRFTVGAVIVLAAGITGSAREPQASTEKSIYVMVTEAQTNKSVTGLPANAFLIREDNIDRQVVRAAPLTEPMAIVLLADTTSAFAKTPRDLRDSAAGFIKRMLTDSPKSSVALWEFAGADVPVENFTSDEAKLEQATTKLFPKGSMDSKNSVVGSNLLEAIASASKALAKRPEARRMIVSFNSDLSAEMSTMPGQQVQDEVQKANATLVAVSLQSEMNNAPKRDNVLDNVCPFSGGRRITISTVQSLAATLENVADLLAGQYVVTYTRPSGSAKQVLIGTPQGLKASTARWAPK